MINIGKTISMVIISPPTFKYNLSGHVVKAENVSSKSAILQFHPKPLLLII